MQAFRRIPFTNKQIAYFFLILFGLNSCGAGQEKTKQPAPEKVESRSDVVKNEAVFIPEQNIDLESGLFDLQSENGNERMGFISLSDIYPLSEHPDSLAIPDVSGKPFDSIRCFKLEKKYRKSFLTETGISENDRVFVYDYAANVLVSFWVKELHVVANLNGYASEEDAPFSQFDYMIGFEIDRNLLKGIKDEYFNNTIVFVGAENPFVIGKLKRVMWKKIDKKQFPLAKMSKKTLLLPKGYKHGGSYTFAKDSLQYYVQDFSQEYWVVARRLLVIHSKTGKVIFERVYELSEGTGMAPLNNTNPDVGNDIQWTGILFKNKAPVIFGLQYFSFGCPEISFLDKKEKDMYINCDNRH